jgi:ubiquinone/menaquinone biosynthesis C-methylase UbiE
METSKIARIKNAIKNNFDQSPAIYKSFEEKHNFFGRLSHALLLRMNLPQSESADILDVGCGTGASCLRILDYLPLCRVWGVDNSPAMLETARTSIGESERLVFIEGDAAKLADYFDFQFDAIIYSASIFLIPDYRESLKGACRLLKSNGSLGLTFMDGIYDTSGNNLFEIADQTAKEGVSLNKPVKLAEFDSFFIGLFQSHRSWNEDFSPPEELLRDFYSVPAMSAGLFPGIDYTERVRKISRLFDHMPKREILFRWRLMIGETCI